MILSFINNPKLKKTNVLIVGAGPTGLMMACQLLRMGIDYIIIDKKEGPTKESRALIIHARSLEIYDQMGIADKVLLQGEIVKKIRFVLKRKKVAEMVIGEIGKGLSKFPYLLIFEQSKNEDLLYDYLKQHNGNIGWQTELQSVRQDEKSVYAELKDRDGKISTIAADWLVAADGAGSVVRHTLNLSFAGDTYEHIFYVADTQLVWPWGHDALSLYISNETFLGLFPMQGKDRFRAIGILPAAYQNEHPDTFEQIVPYIQQQAKIPLQFANTNWFSIYRLHHRCVEQFRIGRIFLCGDAAHIHSPAGGQGMNTGLQDAYNLAWKLAYVINKHAGEDLLNTYEQERLPFAKRLVTTTDQAFRIITSGRWRHRFFRLWIIPFLLPVLFRFRKLQRFAFRTISQIGISYSRSNLSMKANINNLKVKAGERFPYLLFNDGCNVFEKMKEPSFYLLVLFKNKYSQPEDILTLLENEFTGMLKILVVDSNERNIIDSLGVKDNALILVRPDHYIAAAFENMDAKIIRKYFRSLKA